VVGKNGGLDGRVPRLVGQVARPGEQLLLTDRDDGSNAPDEQRSEAVPGTALAAQELAQAVATDAGVHLDRVERLAGLLDHAPQPRPELIRLRSSKLGVIPRLPIRPLPNSDDAGCLLVLRHVSALRSVVHTNTQVLTLSGAGRRPQSSGACVARRYAARTVDARHSRPPWAVGTPASWRSAAIRR
jgi:hypothetical protein